MRSDMQPLLTEEARRMHAEMAQLHERMQAVRDDVLRLSEEQRAAIEEHGMRRRARRDGDALSGLSAEQRATMSIFRALTRGGHERGDGRPRRMER